MLIHGNKLNTSSDSSTFTTILSCPNGDILTTSIATGEYRICNKIVYISIKIIIDTGGMANIKLTGLPFVFNGTAIHSFNCTLLNNTALINDVYSISVTGTNDSTSALTLHPIQKAITYNNSKVTLSNGDALIISGAYPIA